MIIFNFLPVVSTIINGSEYFLRSEKKRIDFDRFWAKIDGVLRKLYKKSNTRTFKALKITY
jgi:hypothetical protein